MNGMIFQKKKKKKTQLPIRSILFLLSASKNADTT